MGVYIFSIRAKTVALAMPDGVEVRANLYSYAYRMTSYWPGDRGANGYRMTEANTRRNADNVFAAPRSGVVIVGEIKQGRDLDDCSVYTDVTSSQWWDTDRFPGTFVGWAEKVGNKYRVTDHTKWTECKSFRDGVWVDCRTRCTFDGVKVTHESVDR